jgi:hypothetical protein
LSIALPFADICSHDPSVDVFPRRSEKIHKLSLSLKRKTRHELSWRGKEDAKNGKKLASEILNVSAVAEFRVSVRDAKSAIVLLMPAMETEMNGDAKALVRRPAMAERDELSLFVQLSIVLSHHAATWTCFRCTRCSSTR